jgi:hypothetical protein
MSRVYLTPGLYGSQATAADIAAGKTLYGSGAAPGGYMMAGTTVFSNKAGSRKVNIFRPAPKSETRTVTEYKTDPEQAKLIAELQKQLKILQDVPKYEPYDFSKEKAEYEERISGLNERIGNIQSGYKTSLEELTTSMRSEREAAEKALGLKFSDQLSAQQKSSAERLAAQQAQSAAQLGEFKDLYQSSQQTAAADRLKFSETLASQQSAAQKEFEALRGTMSQQRQQYEAGLAAERAANEQARQEQAMSFQRSLASQRGAPQVEGIRFATRGPAAQKGMRGISGTFGRKGGRLMKISALNV